MRKTLIFILLLTLLSAGTMAYAALEIYPLRDQVSVREQTELYYDRETFGDASAAEGLTAILKMDWYEALRWETTVQLGDVLPETGTEYTFQLPVQKTQNHFREDSRIELRTDASYVLDGHQVLKDLTEGLEPGERREEKIYLSEYADYYTIQPTLVFPQNAWSWRNETPSTIENDTEAALKKLFDENFLFPIEEKVNVDAFGENHVEYGPGWGFSINSSSEGYSLDVKDVFYGDSAWFAFNRKDPEYTYWNLDVSHLPLGYGVYCLTVPSEGSQPSLVNVCPLSPDTEILKLAAEPDGENILVHTIENGIYTVTVIRTADNAVTQRLELTEFPDSSDDWATYEAEGCTAVALYHGNQKKNLILLTKDADGYYQIQWKLDIPDGQTSIINFYDRDSGTRWYYDYYPVIAWNGRYLAFGLSDEYRDGFDIAIYDEKGLVYSGRYNTSLNLWPVGPDKETPLTLAWE